MLITFNNEKFSDVTIIDPRGQKLYVNSLVLRQNAYFDGILNLITKKEGKLEIKVENMIVSNYLIKYLYTGELTNIDMIISDLMELLKTTEEWMFAAKIKDIELGFVFSLFEKIVEDKLDNLIDIYNLFGDHATIKFKIINKKTYIPSMYCNSSSKYDTEVNIGGDYLEEKIILYLKDNVDKITPKILNSSLAILLSPEVYIISCMNNKLYNLLIDYLILNKDITIDIFNRYISTILIKKDGIKKDFIELEENPNFFEVINKENIFKYAIIFERYDLLKRCKGCNIKTSDEIVSHNIKKLNSDIMNTDIQKFIADDTYAKLLFKFKKYEQLNGLSLGPFKGGLAYYTLSDNIFTLKQLKLLLTSMHRFNPDIHHNVLNVVDYIPFKATHYKLLGKVNFDDVDVEICNLHLSATKLKQGDKFIINDIGKYTIKELYLDDKEHSTVYASVLNAFKSCKCKMRVKLDSKLDKDKSIQLGTLYPIYKITEY